MIFKADYSLIKKIDSFSAEKMAIHGIKWHFSALESFNYGHSALQGPAAHIQRYGYGATRRSAEKTAIHGKKWHF
jgi:hypothetical protein